MLHARSGGETFGLACAEFSVCQRPVFTSSVHNDDGHGNMHLQVLGSQRRCRDFFYTSKESLVRLLMGFNRAANPPTEGFNAYRGESPYARAGAHPDGCLDMATEHTHEQLPNNRPTRA